MPPTQAHVPERPARYPDREDLGQQRVPASLTARLARTARRDGPRQLTAAQREILCLLSTGLTDAAIASYLDISLRTTARRVADLMRQLDASSRFQAGVEAARRGWLK